MQSGGLQSDQEIGNLIDQLKDLQERMIQLEAHALTSQDIKANKIAVGAESVLGDIEAGDIATVPWTDYSGDSTIVGWASFAAKYLYYKKVGKLVYVTFWIQGTSDATTTSFTLPFAANASSHSYQVITRIKNDGTFAVGFMKLSSDASIVVFCKSALSDTSNDWTTNGVKGVYGEFWYEAV